MTRNNELFALANEYQKIVGLKVFRAILGDADGRVDVQGQDGFVYVRYQGANGFSQPMIVPFRVSNMKKTPGMGVLIKYDYDKVWAVVGADYPALLAQGTNPTVNNTADDNNSYWINQYRITTLASHPISSASNSMIVTVQPFFAIIDGVATLFMGDQVDLTASIPGAAGEWGIACIFWKPSDNTLEVVASTPVANQTDLGIADVQECLDGRSDSTNIPVWAWQVFNGQTGITPGNIQAGGDDFLDLRQFINVVDSSSGGSGITQLTGDVTAGPGSGSQAATLANSGVSAGSYTNASVTFDAKGRATAAASGATPAPVGATYITQTPDGTLTNEQALSSLATGLMKVTTTTGVVSSITDSAGLAGVISDETGSGALVFGTAPTLGAPAIADFTSAQHDHLDADDGGTLSAAAIASGQLALARGGTNADLSATGGSNQFVKQSSAGAAFTVGTIADADVPDALTISGGTINNTPIGATTASTLIASAISLLIGGFKAIFTHANSADRTYTFPDVTSTVLTDTATQNFSNKTSTNQFMIDGSSDQIQELVQAHSTQTSLLAVWENSSGTDQVTIAGNGAMVINEAGNDADFRVESDTDVNNIFSDASTNRVGIGTNTPSKKFHVVGEIQIEAGGGGTPAVINFDGSGTSYVLRGISGGGGTRTLNLPETTSGTTDTLVSATSVQGLSNKGLQDSTVKFTDNADGTKQLAFQCSGIATATTRTITMPDADVDLGNLDAATITAGTLDEARLPHKFAIIEEQQTQNTAGGGSTATTWTTRVINTEVADASNLVTLSSNKFTPISGSYHITVNSPFVINTQTSIRLRLRNVTAASVVYVGNNNFQLANGGANVTFTTEFTANGTDEYDIQYWVTVARATNGLGVAVNETGAVERYTNVLLEKIA